MSIPRIYCADILESQTNIILNEIASHHLLVVLRLKKGFDLRLFNESGEYRAKLTDVVAKKAVVSIGEALLPIPQSESPLRVHLGQGISRGDRMDYTIQKSVELGVSEITPIITQRCGVHLSGERLEKRVAHWQAVAQGASEQSGRLAVPKIHHPLTLDAWLIGATGLRFICVPGLSSEKLTQESINDEISVLIGPEGGFNEEEIQQARQQHFQSFSLGPRILRTETAAVVALTLLQREFGDL